MTRYLIKVTYLTGVAKGRSYLLTKGGYVTNENSTHFEDQCYKTLAIANRQCKRLTEENELNYKLEREDNDYRIKRGKPQKDIFLYEKEKYEPYPVEF